MSAKVWESLTEEEQGWVQEAANLARMAQREIAIENEQKLLDKMADAALADACTPSNPRTPTKEDIMKIYKKLWSF